MENTSNELLSFCCFIISVLVPATLLQSELQLDKLRPTPVDSHLCSKTYVIYQLQSSYRLAADKSCST